MVDTVDDKIEKTIIIWGRHLTLSTTWRKSTKEEIEHLKACMFHKKYVDFGTKMFIFKKNIKKL